MNEEEALQMLGAIQAQTYTRVDSNQRRIGFIADDFEAFETLAPALVGRVDLPDLQDCRTLDYAKITSLLWTICRNLQARVQQLENAA